MAALTVLLAVGVLAATATTEASAAGLVAPLSECKAQKNIKAPERQQEDAMRCLLNYARSHSGSGSLGASRSLERAAGQKSGDVMHCGFSHTACGRPADLYARRYGYASASSWAWGENLAGRPRQARQRAQGPEGLAALAAAPGRDAARILRRRRDRPEAGAVRRPPKHGHLGPRARLPGVRMRSCVSEV